METTFTEMNKDKYNIFIMGDFNIDLLQYDTIVLMIFWTPWYLIHFFHMFINLPE